MRKPRYSQIYAKSKLEDGAERALMADEEWGGLLADLTDRGQLTDQRKKIVDRLVRLRVEYAFLFPVVQAEGVVKAGPNGGDVYNMQAAHLHKVEDRMLKLEEALRIPVGKDAAGQEPERPQTAADKYLGRLGPRQ